MCVCVCVFVVDSAFALMTLMHAACYHRRCGVCVDVLVFERLSLSL